VTLKHGPDYLAYMLDNVHANHVDRFYGLVKMLNLLNFIGV
jgi:hypothetical protein